MIFILLLFTHMKMKKMLLGAFLGMFTVAGIAVLPGFVSATDGTTEGGDNPWANPDPANSYISESNEQRLTGSAFLDTVKNAINWILGILATIALVVCLYGGFLMVTAAGDEKKYQKGLGVLKYAAIGLAIIGLSWMIVSVIFWFVKTLWWSNQTESANATQMNADEDWSSIRKTDWGATKPGGQGGAGGANTCYDENGNAVPCA